MDFYTTEEIIEELTKRSSFSGLLIRCETEKLPENYCVTNPSWKITHCNMDLNSAKQLIAWINFKLLEKV